MLTVNKGVTYNSKNEVTDCVFCRISNHDANEPATVVADSVDNKYISFIPIGKVTSCHLLVSPKHHIQNVESLIKKSDANIIKEMIEFGKESLLKYGNGKLDPDNPQDVLFCFHVPPFNSIDHLHLHCIGKPQHMSFTSWIKYFPDGYWCKTADTLIKELQSIQD